MLKIILRGQNIRQETCWPAKCRNTFLRVIYNRLGRDESTTAGRRSRISPQLRSRERLQQRKLLQKIARLLRQIYDKTGEGSRGLASVGPQAVQVQAVGGWERESELGLGVQHGDPIFF